MIRSAGDLGVEIDTGTNEPGDILQRKEPDGWRDYRIDGRLIHGPVDIETLVPGFNRMYGPGGLNE